MQLIYMLLLSKYVMIALYSVAQVVSGHKDGSATLIERGLYDICNSMGYPSTLASILIYLQ